MDLLPTFAALAGTRPPSGVMIDGKNVTDVICGYPRKGESEAKSPHEAFFYYFRDTLECVRSGNWKLRVAQVRGGTADQAPQLFDLENDIGETTDLATQYPAVVKRLQTLADKARNDLGDGKTEGQNQRSAGFIEDARGLTDPR